MGAKMSNSRPLSHLILSICLACLFLPGAGNGQTTKLRPGELEAALADLKTGDIDAREIVVIANAGAVDAIPALGAQFKRSTDDSVKTSIASGLVRLKAPGDTYWNFLVQQVTLVLESNLPDVSFSPSLGKAAFPSPELQAWANAHKVSVNAAGQMAALYYPGKVLSMAETGDLRGVSILRRALQSQNCLVTAFAAKGLAQIQDKGSIPLIIAAAQAAQGRCDSLIAESLVYFDDLQAQSAVDTYLPKEKATLDRQERARGRGVFGW